MFIIQLTPLIIILFSYYLSLCIPCKYQVKKSGQSTVICVLYFFPNWLQIKPILWTYLSLFPISLWAKTTIVQELPVFYDYHFLSYTSLLMILIFVIHFTDSQILSYFLSGSIILLKPSDLSFFFTRTFSYPITNSK